MKTQYYLMFAAAFALCSCGHDHSENEELGHHHEHAEAAPHSSEIQLDEHSAQLFGVRSEVINPGAFHDTYAAYGQIVGSPQSSSVVTSPTSGIVRFAQGIEPGKDVSAGTLVATISPSEVSGGNADASAKAALDAAKTELERITPLYHEGLVTASAYNAAVQAYEQARAEYSEKGASGRATAVSGGAITRLLVQQGQYVNAGEAIAEVSSNKRLTLRVDVPQRYYSHLSEMRSANIIGHDGLAISLEELGGKRVQGSASSLQSGYTPVYFSFNNDGRFVPGQHVEVMLVGQSRDGALTVPVQAVSEQQGHYFIYRRIDEDCFEKIPVKLGAGDGRRVAIISGLKPGDDIVVEGMHAVRLAETSAVAPEGHSHNH